MAGPMWTSAMLVQAEAVQKALGVTDEQKTKLADMAQAMRDQRPGQGGGQRNRQEMTDEEREQWQAQMAERREEMAQRRAEQEKQIAEILDAKQVERLKQIQLQASGAMALMNDDVATQLKVTDDQRDKLRAAMRELMQGGQGGPGAMAEMREKMTAKMMELLSDDQKAAYKKMAGEPFDVSQLRMRGQGGGQRGGN
jgi:hypothetical protein